MASGGSQVQSIPNNHQLGPGNNNGAPPVSTTPTGNNSVITTVNSAPVAGPGGNAIGNSGSSLSSGNNGVIDRMHTGSNSLDRLAAPSCAPQTNPSGSNPGQFTGPPHPAHSPMLSLPLQNQIPIHHTSNSVISTNITNASGQGPGTAKDRGLPIPNQDSNTSIGKWDSVKKSKYYPLFLETVRNC